MKKLYPLIYSILILLVVVSISKCFSMYFFIQITDSMPKGLYYKKNLDKIMIGDIAVFSPPDNAKQIIYERGWLLKNLECNLMKPVVAIENDVVKISITDGLLINNKYFGPVKSYDSKGLPLTVFQGQRKIQKEEFFFASSYCPNSFDSRHFGPIKKNALIGIAEPFVIF